MPPPRPLRLAFFGLPLGALLLAHDGWEIDLAVLSPVEAPGRRRLARRVGHERILDAVELGAELEREVEHRLGAPDLIVSWYWTRRLPKTWLERPRLGAIGVHPSLLPRHRGPNPFFWTIDSGDEETGVSVHYLTERYDEGDVLRRERVAVGERNAWQLARALDRPSLRALRAVVAELASGRAPPREPQDEALATWAPEPEGAALGVSWEWPTARVLARIRALAPVPGLALELEGVRFFVTRAEAVASVPATARALRPGEAAAAGEPAELLIRTGDGAIRLLEAVAGSGGDDGEGSNLPVSRLANLVASRNRAV